MKINVYLHYKGNCEEALKFYEKALGAKLTMLMHYSDAPKGEMECSKDMAGKVMHGRVEIADTVIMGADCPPERYNGQHGFAVNIGTDSVAEAERYWNALTDGAEICMPFEETFWAERFGMLTDKFGIPWMVNCEKKR